MTATERKVGQRCRILFFGRLFLQLVLVVCVASSSHAQAQPDKMVAASNAESIRKMEEAIAPSVKRAKATLPKTKNRFLNGLPGGSKLYVTIRIPGPHGRFEQVFVRVVEWHDATITGLMSSPLALVLGPKPGEQFSCSEKDVLDWTIVKPDGSEEDNFIGKFLDTHQSLINGRRIAISSPARAREKR